MPRFVNKKSNLHLWWPPLSQTWQDEGSKSCYKCYKCEYKVQSMSGMKKHWQKTGTPQVHTGQGTASVLSWGHYNILCQMENTIMKASTLRGNINHLLLTSDVSIKNRLANHKTFIWVPVHKGSSKIFHFVLKKELIPRGQ